MEGKDETRDYIDYEEVGAPSNVRRAKRPSKLTLSVSILFALAAVANLSVWIWVTRGPRNALDEDWNHCGRSSAEAVRRGCVMEPLFYGWMPKQCVYQKLTDRYPVFEDRKWFLEQAMIVCNTLGTENILGRISDLSTRMRLTRKHSGVATISKSTRISTTQNIVCSSGERSCLPWRTKSGTLTTRQSAFITPSTAQTRLWRDTLKEMMQLMKWSLASTDVEIQSGRANWPML